MTKKATRSLGTKLKIATDLVANLSSIGSPSITQEELDVTTLDSEGDYREFIGGFKDAGEVAISGFFEPGNTGQAALYALLKSSESESFEILYPAKLGATWSFDAIVTAFSVTSAIGEAIGFEATLRVTGEPDLNMSASGGLSALSLTGTGGTLSPSFDNEVYAYTFGGVSATSVTVTATAASHTLKLYVDGVFSQNLTTAVASESIPLTENVGKKLTIIAQEEGKSQVVYEVIVVKTS